MSNNGSPETVEETKLADPKKIAEPILTIKDIGDLIPQINANPKCNKMNCYGRGIVGFSIDEKTRRVTVVTCSCVTYKNDGYVKLMMQSEVLNQFIETIVCKKLDDIINNEKSIKFFQQMLMDTMLRLNNERTGVKMKRFFKKLFAKKIQIEGPPVAQSPEEARVVGQFEKK